MPTNRHGWLTFNLGDEADLLALIANGMIWKGSASMQERAVRAILAGKAPLNDKVPPYIASQIRDRLGQDGTS